MTDLKCSRTLRTGEGNHLSTSTTDNHRNKYRKARYNRRYLTIHDDYPNRSREVNSSYFNCPRKHTSDRRLIRILDKRCMNRICNHCTDGIQERKHNKRYGGNRLRQTRIISKSREGIDNEYNASRRRWMTNKSNHELLI